MKTETSQRVQCNLAALADFYNVVKDSQIVPTVSAQSSSFFFEIYLFGQTLQTYHENGFFL